MANYLSSALRPFYQGVTDFLATRLSRPATLVTGASLGQFSLGSADVGFL